MKTFPTALALFAMLSLTASQANARSLVKAHVDSIVSTTRVINLENGSRRDIHNMQQPGSISEQDSLRRLVEAFYYDQFRHSQDPAAPTFLFMSKSSNMLMGIGGVVRMRGWYDWDGAIPANGFMPYLIPIPENPANTRKFGTTPAGTTLFFQVSGQSRIGSYRLYIEANFNGYQGRDFHLKKAYATLGDFTVGYATSTFSDPAALVPTVDAQGATNKTAKTEVLVRYMPTFNRHWSMAVSLETPSSQIATTDGQTEKCSDWLPDLATFLQYQWGEGEHVRLAGIIRNLSYRDLIEQQNRNVTGWGMQLSSIAHPHKAVTTYFTLNYGHGYASLTNDMLAGNYDLVADPAAIGKLYAPLSWGYCIGVQYNFTHNLFASTSFSQTHYLPKHTPSPDEYRYGWCADINVFWDILPRLQVGAEFDIGRRMNHDGSNRYAKRIGAMCQFSF